MQPSKKQIEKKAKGITLGLLVAIILFLLCAIIFWRITDEIVLEKGTGLDLSVYHLLSRFITPANTNLMLFFTLFGSMEFLLPAYILLACWFLFYKKDRLNAFVVVAIGISSKLLLMLLKNIFRRNRPPEPLTAQEMGYSYPSGHSFSAFIFFGLLTYLTWKLELPVVWKWILSILFILTAVLTATSRVYLHVHFASDAIASFCLSVIWLGISLWIVQKIKKTNI